MDFLKRSLAPITEAAWEAIDDEARRVLSINLTARQVVDVAGPKGLDFAAVSLGRLEVPDKEAAAGVRYGIPQVQPLVELRASFELNIWELDNIERGAKDLDLSSLTEAARRLAHFEDQTVYCGFKPAKLPGLCEVSTHKPLSITNDARTYPERVSQAILLLRNAGVEGPYALVLGDAPYLALTAAGPNYPLLKTVEHLLDGPVIHTAVLKGGFLVSTRGGDLELTLGQDLAIGYETHDTKTVRLYLTESFTFQVLTPEAAVCLDLKEK
ncbi:MAG: family 1 encapsulin nanocompartment shell protein [Candidatus Neomarinimicrobiota bacterium]